ncbi:hypothetical protein [Streptomyces cylindrosporus]|uniref:Uncharacterized protein n=1 Tax=Streptomyces cylindrosporus TaxID=2927583 RepID=A0ABS9YJY4_9ACTN|nr:hypothetical protein [Streptomyces cylindrosporus]MCI3277565.1 hypothetical protein [Streptomyces cylindrosporus]
MKGPLNSYVGWHDLPHAPRCPRPNWEAQVHTDHEALRGRTASPVHSCSDEDCPHRDEFELTTIRLVCRACGNAHVLTAELRSEQHTRTTAIGYGMRPRRASRLLLWPGQPWSSHGRMAEHPYPHDYVVTREGVKRVNEGDVVGTITLTSGKRGGLVWTAAAVPDPDNEFAALAPGLTRWKHVQQDLRSIPAAAKFIAAHLEGGDA